MAPSGELTVFSSGWLMRVGLLMMEEDKRVAEEDEEEEKERV